ncbi:MAG: prepilin peptidase [Bacilli bacterium]|nr:prepilin peptidase [Bacilli bacterium]
MFFVYLLLFLLLGIILGSLFVTLGIRLSDEDEKVFSRNHCDTCYHKLTFLETIPIISYLFLKGKCRYCHKKIDIKNPIIEISTGILYALTFYVFGFSYELLIGLGIISLLVIVCVSDLTYLVIPDEVLIFFSGYFIVIQYLRLGLTGLFEHIIMGIFLFTIMYTIMLVGDKLLKKECLGGGDVKMMFLFGLVLDPLLGTLTIFLGSFLALPISIVILKRNKNGVIPFGPFLLLAFTLVYFTKLTPDMIINWLGF